MTPGPLSQKPEPEPEEPCGDELAVRAWRLERFLALGYGEVEAALLADAGADHHRAELLLRAGCPPDLALRILLP